MDDLQTLVDQARIARDQAYAPYSRFLVGAALRTKGGRVFLGANVENASYGLTICAERVAIGSAIAAGERDFEAIAVVADTKGPVTPCGACRQVIFEFGEDIHMALANLSGSVETMPINELLPRGFGPADLGEPK
jgi:cytidine deaminase